MPMKLNNKGFAITGILYTVFILFLLITVAVLAGLQSRKTMLEKSTMKLEESYEGKEQNSDLIDAFNKGENSIAPVTGKYEFYITNNFFKEVETPQDFGYTGEVQTFTTKKPGYYKIELWGAQGGKGGKGGYTAGFLNITEEDIDINNNGEYKLYVYVGGVGNDEETTTNEGGWNGGGASGNNDASNSYGGGGATDVRLIKASDDITVWDNAKSLRSRIMVAGGGGGGFNSKSESYTQNPGVGGNLTGGTGTGSYNNPDIPSGGGTQTSGGTGLNDDKKGLFGKAAQISISGWGGGGGGGYWGGAMGNGKPGGGGSSYISGYLGSVAIANENSEANETPRKDSKGQQCTNGTTNIECSEHYSGKKFSYGIMLDGASIMPNPENTGYIIGKKGNGYARITYYGQSISKVGTQYLYGFTGQAQEFTSPEDGTYKIELWGAQGGGVDNNYGGKGAYTTGRIKLEKDEKLYIYVGNYGYMPDNLTKPFNGGGAPDTTGNWPRSHRGEFSGGGATDIRFFGKNKVPTTDGLKWDSEIGLASRIMVAAGGGGGNNGDGSSGGVGGTLNGGVTYDNNDKTKPVSIPTQITGNKFGIGQESGLYPNNHGADTGAGGGGYWGGFRGLSTASGGSGGSSYISGHKNCIAIKSANDTSPRNDSNGEKCIENSDDVECSKHYSGKIFTDTAMYDGNNLYMPSPVGIGIMTGNAGNGFAKITYLGKEGEVAKTDITCVAYIKKGVNIKDNLKFTTKECNDVKYSFVFEKTENDNVMALARIYSFEE